MTSTSTPDHILALLSTIPTPDIQQSPPSTSIHPTRSVSPVQLSHSDSTLDTLPPTSSVSFTTIIFFYIQILLSTYINT